MLRLASDVTLYYELERRFLLSMRVIPRDIAFMRAGGSANAGVGAMWLGTKEIYRTLARRHGAGREQWPWREFGCSPIWRDSSC